MLPTQQCFYTNNFASLYVDFRLVNQEKLIQFRAQESVGFPLLSDPNKSTLNAYGAYGEKLLYGKLINGVIRSTFVIDVDQKGQGTIAVAQYNVKATGHVDKLKRDLHL